MLKYEAIFTDSMEILFILKKMYWDLGILWLVTQKTLSY